MRKLNLIVGAFIILITVSCSSSELKELSENCICEVNEHLIISTDDVENRTKRYTFKHSRLFDLGVSEDEFANSFALQICNIIGDSDDFDFVQIDIIDRFNGVEQLSETYTFSFDKLKKGLPKYLKLQDFVDKYVENILNKNYYACMKSFSFDNPEKFKEVINNVCLKFDKRYRGIKIVEYELKNGDFNIFGLVKSGDNDLNLFKMKIREIDGDFRIINFTF